MDIIYEHFHQNTEAIRLFTSNATPRKNSLRIHHHVMIELSLILKGKGIYKAGDRSYSISEGDIFLYRPNEAHCITDIEAEGMALLNLHIAPHYLYKVFPRALGSNYTKILTTQFNIESNKINDLVSKDAIESIRNQILRINAECKEKNSDFLTMVINSICNILIEISRCFSKQADTKSKNQSYRQVLTALEYINCHFREQITLDNLASSVGYSRCYFSDVFKKCLGMSVWEYICIKRIEEALFLIKTTDKNILQIAFECGFNNTANFNKTFKKYTHMLPHEFRK